MNEVLALDGLTVTTTQGHRLLESIDLTVAGGDRVALLGPSGIGKTTLLRAVLDDLPPGFARSGTVRLGGAELTRRHQIGEVVAYLPQDAGASLTPTMRLRTLLREALPPGAASAAIAQTLQTVGLPTDRRFLARRPWQLSGGQQRRVALARALLRRRPLLLLDEPTAGLDSRARDQVVELLTRACERHGGAVLLVTHDEHVSEALDCRVHRVGTPRTTPAHRPRVTRTPGTGLSLTEADIAVPGGGTLLHGVTLELPSSSITALVAASGSGKTTLARAIAGFHPLRRGLLTLAGTPLPPHLRHRSRDQRRAVQLVAQSAHDAFTPGHTIASSLHAAAPVTDPSTLLEPLHLDLALLERTPDRLSGGQRQRLALVRALSVRPRVLLLDEPASALDPETAEATMAMVSRAAEAGTAVLLITHEEDLSARWADTLLTIAGHPASISRK